MRAVFAIRPEPALIPPICRDADQTPRRTRYAHSIVNAASKLLIGMDIGSASQSYTVIVSEKREDLFLTRGGPGYLPKPGRHAKEQAESNRGVCRDGALAIDQLADPARRDIDAQRAPDGAPVHDKRHCPEQPKLVTPVQQVMHRVITRFLLKQVGVKEDEADGAIRPVSSNSRKAFATDDWFGIVIMRIQRPSTRSWFTALNDCEPPDTCITAWVLPCVGRIAPTLSERAFAQRTVKEKDARGVRR